MQVELLRDLLNQALIEPNEETRVGVFWCFVPDYDDCISAFRVIFLMDNIEMLATDECTVTRIDNGFLIKDMHGNKDIITNEGMLFKKKETVINLYS